MKNKLITALIVSLIISLIPVYSYSSVIKRIDENKNYPINSVVGRARDKEYVTWNEVNEWSKYMIATLSYIGGQAISEDSFLWRKLDEWFFVLHPNYMDAHSGQSIYVSTSSYSVPVNVVWESVKERHKNKYGW